jgi:hypothetical protein
MRQEWFLTWSSNSTIFPRKRKVLTSGLKGLKFWED